jgi:hypothetical protein
MYSSNIAETCSRRRGGGIHEGRVVIRSTCLEIQFVCWLKEEGPMRVMFSIELAFLCHEL